jgi:endothelin-converting enzyme
MTPSYFRGLNDILQNTSKETILRYTQSQLLTGVASHLSQEFRTAVLTFEKVVSGVSAEDPRWQTCLDRTDSALGFALGKLFVDKAFSGNSKTIAESMIQTIVASFKNNLGNLAWMDEPTRQLAREKADAVIYKIGYPDWIQNSTLLAKYYENMTITKNEYFQNVLNIRQYSVKKNQAEIYKPVDKSKWEMTPMTVNAYYNPSNNEIVFPAGILQPPFFDQSYPLAYNYGAIGVVMGHELTHGFDDQGSQYDKAGNLRPWWESSVRQNFNERTECMSEQYSKYEVVTSNDGSETSLVNGNLTLGENIADNGGLKEAYDALETALAGMTASAAGSLLGLPALNLTKEQLYYVGFAQIWCSNIRPAAAYLSLQQDPHSPHPYRVIGSVSNSVQFANAFRCPADSPMNPSSKCVVW